jgi:Uma2 family endonuclease
MPSARLHHTSQPPPAVPNHGTAAAGAASVRHHALGQIALHLPAALRLDDSRLFAICQANRELRIERNPGGDLEIMPPTGAETGARNADLTAIMAVWAKQDGRGIVFDSSTGFLLPNGAMRSPDVAWVLRARLSKLTPAEKRYFLPLVPDLVIELASPSDSAEALMSKMSEWQSGGVAIGWLILPDQRQVWDYRPGREPVRMDAPQLLSDAQRLPALSLALDTIWEPNL